MANGSWRPRFRLASLNGRDPVMTTWVMDHARIAFASGAVQHIGDITLNLLIAASGIALFMIGGLFLA